MQRKAVNGKTEELKVEDEDKGKDRKN